MDANTILCLIRLRQRLHRDTALGLRPRLANQAVHGDLSWAIAEEYDELLREIEAMLPAEGGPPK